MRGKALGQRLREPRRYIAEYDESQPGEGFVRYEVCVKYNNEDRIEANFQDKRTAIKFLKGLR